MVSESRREWFRFSESDLKIINNIWSKFMFFKIRLKTKYYLNIEYSIGMIWWYFMYQIMKGCIVIRKEIVINFPILLFRDVRHRHLFKLMLIRYNFILITISFRNKFNVIKSEKMKKEECIDFLNPFSVTTERYDKTISVFHIYVQCAIIIK